jgi:hypothetical protein
VKSGEIRWYTFQLPDKRRPVLVLTRSEVVDRLNELTPVDHHRDPGTGLTPHGGLTRILRVVGDL